MIAWFLKNPALSTALAVCAALAIALGASRIEVATVRASEAKAAAAFAQANFDGALAQAQAERAARLVEQRQHAALAGVVAHYEQEKRDVETNAARVADGLRDGTLRLRSQWAGCETDRLSADARTAAALAEQDGLRGASLQRVLGWVGQLQVERNECVDGWAAVAAESAVRVMQGAGQ